MKKFALAVLLPFAAVWPAVAQSWDTSGNGLLKGTYYFRQVAWQVGDQAGNLSGAESIYGNITFDGNGNYNVSGAQIAQPDSNGNVTPKAFGPVSGTYAISVSGYGAITSLVNSSDKVFGLVSKGIFIGSATENAGTSTTLPYNDMFIAAPLASPAPTNGTFQGSYTLFNVDSFSGSPQDTSDALLKFNADGNGNLGTVTVSGYVAGNGASLLTQNISSVKYRFSNGAAVASLGNCTSSTILICGDKYLYFSPDGNFVFGGAPNGWDMIVGLRNPTSTPSFSGLYYQAALEQDESALSAGVANTDSYFGAVYASQNAGSTTAGTILAHQRLLSPLQFKSAIDYTYSDPYTLSTDGSYSDANYYYIFGAGGAIRIGIGDGTILGINVAVQGPTLSGTGVYIDATGVINNGSFSPFTASLSPGELISIYGSNLANKTDTGDTLPLTLDGVQVMINNRPAPIYYISSGRVIVVVPLATTEPIAAIQVINNGSPSNTVTNYMSFTSPGLFPENISGVNYAAAQHVDYTQITPSSPATPGETIQVYLTGLGTIGSDGKAGNSIAAYVDGMQATVIFAGSGLAVGGGYQLNLTIPSGVSTGNVYLDISGPDSYNSEYFLPIAASSSTRSVVPHQAHRRRPQLRAPAPKSLRK